VAKIRVNRFIHGTSDFIETNIMGTVGNDRLIVIATRLAVNVENDKSLIEVKVIT